MKVNPMIFKTSCVTEDCMLFEHNMKITGLYFCWLHPLRIVAEMHGHSASLKAGRTISFNSTVEKHKIFKH